MSGGGRRAGGCGGGAHCPGPSPASGSWRRCDLMSGGFADGNFGVLRRRSRSVTRHGGVQRRKITPARIATSSSPRAIAAAAPAAMPPTRRRRGRRGGGGWEEGFGVREQHGGGVFFWVSALASPPPLRGRGMANTKHLIGDRPPRAAAGRDLAAERTRKSPECVWGGVPRRASPPRPPAPFTRGRMPMVNCGWTSRSHCLRGVSPASVRGAPPPTFERGAAA